MRDLIAIHLVLLVHDQEYSVHTTRVPIRPCRQPDEFILLEGRVVCKHVAVYLLCSSWPSICCARL